MVLLIDNYDSFTYNLYDYFKILKQDVLVIKNDEKNINEIKKLNFKALVISPGPKTPSEAGITLQLINEFKTSTPILGICLGHQAIGQYFGADLIKANKPMHGKVSEIFHDEENIFKGLPNPIKVCRYHSLNLSSKNINSLPFKVTSTTKDKEWMSIQHNTLPIVGIQFHPEAILTEFGLKILENWLKMFDI